MPKSKTYRLTAPERAQAVVDAFFGSGKQDRATLHMWVKRALMAHARDTLARNDRRG